MKLRHIILFGLMIISPLLLAARNEVGSQGGGCGCPWLTPGGEVSEFKKDTVDEQPKSETTITKSVFDNMPEMDSIIIVKTDQVFQSNLWKYFSNISEENSSLDGLVSLFKKGKLFTEKSASLSKGISKVEEAISADDKNLIILGFSFDWSATDPKIMFSDMQDKPSTSPKLKDLFAMVYGSLAVSKDIADLLEGLIPKDESSDELEIGDKKLSAHKGPELCEGEGDKKVCKNSPVYITEMEDGIAIIGTGDMVKSYYENSAGVSKSAGLKNNTTWTVLQGLPDSAVLAAMSTPLMEKIRKYYNSEDVSKEFKKQIPLFWLGDDLPSYLACGMGIKVMGDMGVTVHCSILDPNKVDFKVIVELDEDLANLINWAGFKELKLFENKDCDDSPDGQCTTSSGDVEIKRGDSEGDLIGNVGSTSNSLLGGSGNLNGITRNTAGGNNAGGFNISLGSVNMDIMPGESKDIPIIVVRNNNFSGEITFEVEGELPQGMTISFDPTTCPSTCPDDGAVSAHVEFASDITIEAETDFFLKVKGTSGLIWSETGIAAITMKPNPPAP